MTTTDTKTEVQRLAEATLAEAQLLESAYRGEADEDTVAEDYGLEPDFDYVDLLNTMALEVYASKNIGANRDWITSVTVITGTGGPHTEFSILADGRVTAKAIWGSDSAEAKGSVSPSLFDSLSEMLTIE